MSFSHPCLEAPEGRREFMPMLKEDAAALQGSIEIMRHTYRVLRRLPAREAAEGLAEMTEAERDRYRRKDGKDTRRFDIVAEQEITNGNDFKGHLQMLRNVYDEDPFTITEEQGRLPRPPSRIEDVTPVIVSDPVDRSSYLERLIAEMDEPGMTLGDIFDAERERLGEQARVEGCNSSVTLIKDNKLKYSVILNLFTGEAYCAFEEGVFKGDIRRISAKRPGHRVTFRSDETDDILFYTKPGKYDSNRHGTCLRFFDLVSIPKPGGPIRFTYLLEENAHLSSVGLIAHNGEKIQESLPNVVVAFWARDKERRRQLASFRLHCEEDYKEHQKGYRLTPVLRNSIYEHGLIRQTGIKAGFLNNREYPSAFRDTIVTSPIGNGRAMATLYGLIHMEQAMRIV